MIVTKTLSAIILSVFWATPAYAGRSEFCAGFKQGYITGYKQASGNSYDPYAPYCPYQPYKGYNDPKSDSEHGYVIGYEQGKKAGSK